MTALWIIGAWLGVSALAVVLFALGASLGYRRGWEERGELLQGTDSGVGGTDSGVGEGPEERADEPVAATGEAREPVLAGR